MQNLPKIPKDIIDEIYPKHPKKLSGQIVKMLYDGKQFSFKIPADIARRVMLKKEERFQVIIEDEDILRLKRVK